MKTQARRREKVFMKIAVLSGDGIGPEIVAQAVRVLEALRSDGLKFELEPGLLGGARSMQRESLFPKRHASLLPMLMQ